ncbi:MAG: hypothetical protein JSS81_06195 [Acidobacteria bacterium]|nr:hypothetical protein [Acidobacteriota bacterium]
MKKFLLLILSGVLLTACGGGAGTGPAGTTPAGPGKLSMDFKTLNTKTDVKKDLEIKKGVVTPVSITLDGKPIVRYFIDLTDFDYDANAAAKPADDKQTAVEITLFGDSGDTVETPLKAKTFELSSSGGKVDDKYGRVSNVLVKTFKDGKVEETSLTYNAKGTVKIVSATAETVTGEIDLTQDGGGRIKGSFTAQLKKK